MKKGLFTIILVCFAFIAIAQEEKQILGVWLTQDGDSKVEIVQKADGTFDGKIIWLKTPNREDGSAKKDDKNPDVKMQQRPIMGLKLLAGFKYSNSDKEWVEGTIYDPKSGSTYKCYMWFDGDKNSLNVKGYIGISVIGKKVIWKRVMA